MSRTKRQHPALESWARRAEALKNPIGSGLVVVRCKHCNRPIATTKQDQKRGEPPVLLDFPENATNWVCTECALPQDSLLTHNGIGHKLSS